MIKLDLTSKPSRRSRLVVTKALPLIALAGFLMVGYTNCSDMAPRGVPSLASEVTSATNCDEALLKTYETAVYPFFRSNETCMGCHIEGGTGIGSFASGELARSFASFTAAGLPKVSFMATNPQHKPPYTGIHHQTAINAINKKWVQAERTHLDCVSRSSAGGVDESILTSAKPAPLIYSSRTTGAAVQTLSWNLQNASDLDESVKRSIPAVVSVDMSVIYQTTDGVTQAIGYTFENPRMKLTDDTVQILAEGLSVQINRQPVSSQTAFIGLSKIIRGTSEVPLVVGKGNTLMAPITTTDTFALHFRRLVPTSASEEYEAPLAPLLSLSDRATSSAEFAKDPTVYIRLMRDPGILRWCVTETATKPASVEAPCNNPGATDPATTKNGWYMQRPVSFTLSSGDGLKRIYVWVVNEGLKMNEAPATAEITLDRSAPAAPTIGSIRVTDTQVADLTVTHANEADVSEWCVFDQSATLADPAKPKLDDLCWRWSENGGKPTTVGFKGGGTRKVAVFVRDKAGNVSAASNIVSIVNPFGAITHSDLIGPSSDARSIFTRRCSACHRDSSAPGYGRVDLWDYSKVVLIANGGPTSRLVIRTNDPRDPMPNTTAGLMPLRERDLIRLWTMPENSVDKNMPLE